jgi:hypothetical protein
MAASNRIRSELDPLGCVFADGADATRKRHIDSRTECCRRPSSSARSHGHGPPDPLADIAREVAGHDGVLSSGTFLDSVRFRIHLGRHFGLDTAGVEAPVTGDKEPPRCSCGRQPASAVAGDFALMEQGEKLDDLRRQRPSEHLSKHHDLLGARCKPVCHRDRIDTDRRGGAALMNTQ